MKAQLIALSILNLSVTTALFAQGPVSATLTNPTNKTFVVPKNPKIPPVNLPCQMSNGKPRPFACEFRLDKLVFLGKNGTPLATVKPSKAFPASTPLPFNEAKSSAPAGTPGNIVYTVKVFLTRLNPPPSPENKTYRVRTSGVTDPLPSDSPMVVLTNPAVPGKVGQQTSLTLDLTWQYNKKAFTMMGPKSLFIDNTHTVTLFPSGQPLSDSAEASIKFIVSVTGDPSE